MHRVFVDALPSEPQTLAIEGDEAAHALRVKRVRSGEHVELLDGRGHVAAGVVLDPRDAAPGAAAFLPPRRRGEEAPLLVRIESVRAVEPLRPRLEVLTAAPKGPRLADLIDQLAQAGAASWAPLSTARSVVDPREARLERLVRVAREAGKQCGRAWTLGIGPPADLPAALAHAPGLMAVVADASGEPWRHHAAVESYTVRLLVGPEGGWTPEELDRARAAGATIARFGPHTMRIETAAVVAAGVILAHARV
jgi:16S rRNA (uracil1498-N3)-methyltransferase